MAELCQGTGNYGTGCARFAGHDGAHWLTGNPDRAREALDREGIDMEEHTCAGYQPKMPEWRRRALEQAAGKPLTAVKELS